MKLSLDGTVLIRLSFFSPFLFRPPFPPSIDESNFTFCPRVYFPTTRSDLLFLSVLQAPFGSNFHEVLSQLSDLSYAPYQADLFIRNDLFLREIALLLLACCCLFCVADKFSCGISSLN